MALAINNLDEVAPTITSAATATAINENSGAGQLVYTGTATDAADISAGISYSLKASTGDVSAFSINSSTGVVTLTDNPNFEVKSSYSFTVVASDAAGNASERAVTLGVTNLNEAPATTGSIGTQTAVANQPFSLGLQSYFSDIDATGSFGTLSYAVTAGSLPAGLTLNSSTGVLSGTASGVASASNISVTATDGGGLSAIQTFSLGVVAAPVIQSFVVTDAVGTTSVGRQGDALTFSVLLSEAVDITGGTPTIVFSAGGKPWSPPIKVAQGRMSWFLQALPRQVTERSA